MRHLLYLISCLLMVIILGCGGTTSYWTYTRVDPPTHVTHPTYIPVWVDSTFTPYQIQDIKAALNEWNYVLNGRMVLTLQTKKALGIDKQMHDYPLVFADWDDGIRLTRVTETTGLGWVVFNLPTTDKKHWNPTIADSTLAYVTGPDTHQIFVISDRLGTRSLKDIMLHEDAHILGAMHVNAPSLEYPTYDNHEYSCIDKITAAQVAHHQGFDLGQLNYCITPYFE